MSRVSARFESGPTVFILNVSLAGMAAARSLGRQGVPVVGLDPDSRHPGFHSRYCRAAVSPHPVYEPDQLVEFLLKQAEQLESPGILSPASDAFALFVSRYRETLGGPYRFALPSAATMESVVNKRSLYELADRHSVPHADTHYPSTMDDVHQIKNDLSYPVYVKPYESHVWELTMARMDKGVKAKSPAELVETFTRLFETGVEAMVQSIILGPASNVRTVYMYMDENSEPLAAMTTRKFRQYPAEFGTGSMSESYYDPELRDMGIDFFRRIKFRGFGTAEFKLDDRDDKWKLTDLNPRWVKPIALPIDSGMNFPLIEYLDLIGERPEPQFDYKSGVRWLQAVNDFASAWPQMRAGTLSPFTVAGQWMSARSFSTFAMDDWKPFLKESRYGTRILRAPRVLMRQKNSTG